MAVSGTSSNRFMAEFDKKLPEGQEAGIRAYKMPAGMSKIFTFMTTVTIDNQTVVVNKKSLEKFMDRHGQSGFKCEKKSAEQLGAMLKSVSPAFKPERDNTLKMLAAMGKGEQGVNVADGKISIQAAKLDSFVNQLTAAGIRLPASWVSGLKEKAKGNKEVEISGGQLKELQQLAEKLLQDVPADKSSSNIEFRKLKSFAFKHDAPDQRVLELLHKNNTSILELAKSHPVLAEAMLAKISPDIRGDQKTCLEGAAIVIGDKNSEGYKLLAELIRVAHQK